MRIVLVAMLGVLVAAVMSAAPGPEEVSARARKLHFSSIVMDTHDDTTQRLIGSGDFDLGKRWTDGSIDIPRMKEGGLGGIFFSIFISPKITGPDAVKRAIDQIDAVREQVRRHPSELALATTAEQVREIHKQGKIAALMGVEGGHMIDNDLGVLRTFAALGVRYMTLTHTGNTDWADSANDKPGHNGLTPFGKDVVREMNRLGVIVDISHVADKTFYDALEVSKAPIIASHSSCRALCNVPRNMTDDMMRALAAKGGVIQINYHIGFLSQDYQNAYQADPKIDAAILAEIERVCHGNDSCRSIERDKVTREFVAQGKLPRVDWTKIIDHIDHAVKVAGVDHVGLGSDFDGADMPFGMEDASKLPKITEGLIEKGYSDADIRKILGENTLRVMTGVEQVSREMNAAK